MTLDELMEIENERVEKAVRDLGEYYDSVQIFVSRHESAIADGTIMLERGGGNVLTRIGHVRQWLIQQDEYVRAATRKDCK